MKMRARNRAYLNIESNGKHRHTRFCLLYQYDITESRGHMNSLAQANTHNIQTHVNITPGLTCHVAI